MTPGDRRGCFILLARARSAGLARRERWLVRCTVCLRDTTLSEGYLSSNRLNMHGCAICAIDYKRDRFKRA